LLIEERAAALRVHFTGHVADDLLPALYAGAVCFAYLSTYEGFGLPPLEAMASGTPVLTGNLTSLPEVVGDAGIMVNPHDGDAIAAGLKELVGNQELRNRLGAAGAQRAKQFTWDAAAEKTLAVLAQ
jgi:glycosyltransferase involved in cell wall biosynthesis